MNKAVLLAATYHGFAVRANEATFEACNRM